MEYESGGRDALLSFWLECDKGQGPILFPPDASNRAIPPHLFRSYRRLWLTYEHSTTVLGGLLNKGWRKTPRLWRMILSAAYSELMWSDASQAFAIVHSWVEIAKKRGNKVAVAVVNGCLRNICRQMDSGVLTLEQSIPLAFKTAWIKSGGNPEMFTRILDDQRRQFWYPMQFNAESSVPVQEAESVGDGELKGWRLPLGIFPDRFVRENGGFLQNLSAAELCVQILESFNERGGGRFLDYCAAPGGKTWQLSRLGLSELYYHDENPKRIHEMETSSLAGEFKNARKVSAQMLDDGQFDAVLLDVPCSNSGVLAKCPEAIRHYWKSGDDFLEVQESALLKGLSLLRPGGSLYYSTCSIDTIENRDRIEAFARQYDLKIRFDKTWLPDLAGRHGAYLACLEFCE